MPAEYVTLVIGIINALLWGWVCFRILHHDKTVSRLIRQLITTVLFLGMLVFALDGLAPFGVPLATARFVSTVFTVYAGLIALAIVSSSSNEQQGK